MLHPFFQMHNHYLRRVTRDALVEETRRVEFLASLLGKEPLIRVTSLTGEILEPEVPAELELLLWKHVLGPTAFHPETSDSEDPSWLPGRVEVCPMDAEGKVSWVGVEVEGPTRICRAEYELVKPLWAELNKCLGISAISRTFSSGGRTRWMFWLFFDHSLTLVHAEEVLGVAEAAFVEVVGPELVIRQLPLHGETSFVTLPFSWMEAGSDWSGVLLRPVSSQRLLVTVKPDIVARVRTGGLKGSLEERTKNTPSVTHVSADADLNFQWTPLFECWEKTIGTRAVRAGELVDLVRSSLPEVADRLGHTGQIRAVRLGGLLRKMALAGVTGPYTLQARASGHGTRFVLQRKPDYGCLASPPT